jgi:hypothetical protein
MASRCPACAKIVLMGPRINPEHETPARGALSSHAPALPDRRDLSKPHDQRKSTPTK